MKQKRQELEDEHKLEILKAVAQAWYGHSGSSSSLPNEFDARRRNFKNHPSRFRIEAMRSKSSSSSAKDSNVGAGANWDFRQSLWDSYEIVAVSRKLETELVLDNPFSGLDDSARVQSRRKESKNSLRNLFNRFSSRRYDEPEAPQ